MLSSMKIIFAVVSTGLLLCGCDWLAPVAYQATDRDDLTRTFISDSDVSDDGRYAVYARGGDYYESVEYCEPVDPNILTDPNEPQDPNEPMETCEVVDEYRLWRSPIYVYDFYTKETIHANVNSEGEAANGPSSSPVISGNGRFVAFSSNADNLVAHDYNGTSDVFVHDLMTGETSRVSVNSAGEEGNAYSGDPVISDDGNIVAFLSDASNFSSLNHYYRTRDVYVHNRTTGITQLVSANTDGTPADSGSLDPALSGDGRFVAFQSRADNLLSTGTTGISDVYLHDTQTRSTVLVSKNSAGHSGSLYSSRPALSFDGRYTAFETNNNFDSSDTRPSSNDVYIHDRVTGQTEWVSTYTGDGGRDASISDDGRYVAFSNIVYLPPGNYDYANVWIHDRELGITREASLTATGEQATGTSSDPQISGNGRYVLFETESGHYDEAATDSEPTVFLRAVPGLEVVSITPAVATIGTPVSNVVVVNENTITLDIMIPDTEAQGAMDVTVILPGSGAGIATGSTALCVACLEFIDPVHGDFAIHH